MVQPERRAARADEPAQAEPGHTMIYSPRTPQATQAASADELGVEAQPAASRWPGTQRREVEQRRVIGRSRECDVQLADPNVSRRHAELRQEGASYWIVDLDSTNGIEVNGRKLKREARDGDRVTVGSTEWCSTGRGADDPGRLGSVDELLLILKIGVPRAALPLHLAHRAASASRRRPAAPNERVMVSPGQASALGLTGAGAGRRRPQHDAADRRGAPARRAGAHRRPLGGQRPRAPRATSTPPRARRANRAAPGPDVLGQDDGSTNGTYVNGQRIEAPRGSLPGDVVRHRGDRAAVRGGVMGLGQAVSDTGRKRRRTRTRTPCSHRCSRSPTGWAVRRRARSPRGSPSRRSPTTTAGRRRGARRRARPGGQPPGLRARGLRQRHLGDGDDDDRRAGRERHRRDRARRRLARLPRPRRRGSSSSHATTRSSRS